MTHPRDAALAWIRSALTEELRGHADIIAAAAAEMMMAIAEDYDVPTEECIRWIHMEMRQYSARAWITHCIDWHSRHVPPPPNHTN